MTFLRIVILIPRVKPEGMLFRKPVCTPDQVRGRLFRDHAQGEKKVRPVAGGVHGTDRPKRRTSDQSVQAISVGLAGRAFDVAGKSYGVSGAGLRARIAATEAAPSRVRESRGRRRHVVGMPGSDEDRRSRQPFARMSRARSRSHERLRSVSRLSWSFLPRATASSIL